jgi:hypothetical protein
MTDGIASASGSSTSQSTSTPGSSAPSGLKQELSGDAQRLKETATQRATEQANAQKDKATGAAHSTSAALQKAAEELRGDEAAPNWLGTAFEKAAQEIDRFAGTIENQDISQIGRQVSDFARRSPTAFLAASAAAGFAAARLLRAGSEHQAQQEEQQQGASTGASGSSYGSAYGAGGEQSASAIGQSWDAGGASQGSHQGELA